MGHHDTTAPKISHSELLQLVSYDPETGIMRSRVNRRKVKIGQIIGCDCGHGYSMRIIGHRSLVHRYAWFYMTGCWPTKVIDHINRNPYDNRFKNLRQCTQAENRRNSSKPRHNTSGVVGVLPDKRGGNVKPWRAQITINNRCVHIGSYDTKEEAMAARKIKAAELWGDFAPAEGA